MKLYLKFINLAFIVLKGISALCTIIMLCIMMAEVFRRYIFGVTWMWSDEVIRYLLIATAFLGGACAFRQGALVSFDLVTSKLSGKNKVILDIVNNTICALFALFVMVLSIKKIMMPSMSAQVSVNTGIPVFVPYLVIPIGMLSIVLFAIENYPVLFKNIAKSSNLNEPYEGK